MDPRLLYTIDPQVWAELAGERPVLIHLLEGFVDAGQVAQTVSAHLLDQCIHRDLAVFDHDQLHDYRSRRPQMVFDTNQWVGLTDYNLTLHRLLDAHGRSFLLLAGPEPDTQWNRLTEAVLGLATDLGVSQLVTITGVPMGVPHTRPVLVTGHATDPELAPANPVWIDRVTIPGSFGAMLEYRAGQRGLLARGFVAHVPHYLAQGPFPPGAAAVLHHIIEATGLALPTDDLDAASIAALEALDAEVRGDDELAPLVTALEEQYDQLQAKGQPPVPTADEIGETVERFLAERTDDDPE